MKKINGIVAMLLLMTTVSLVAQTIDTRISLLSEIPESITCCRAYTWNFVLEDVAGNPLGGKALHFTGSFVNYQTVTTDAAGIAILTFGAPCDSNVDMNVTATAQFLSDEQYNTSTLTFVFHMVCVTPTITVPPTPLTTPVPTIDPSIINPVTLTLVVINDGQVVVSPPNETVRASNNPSIFTYERNTIVSLTPIVPTPWPCGSGCIQPAFLGWEGDTVTYNEIVMDSDKSVTARFRNFESAPTPIVTPSSVTPEPTPSGANPMGDVNGDGSITIVDALYVAQYYVGLIQTFVMPQNADVNRDGNVTIVDALQIARCYVGVISCSF